jgi:hypothetical protein
MGKITGPVPKRSEERVRRNAEVIPIDKLVAAGLVIAPNLALDDPHPMVVNFYDSLKESAQAKYYEPSDWEYARYVMYFINKLLRQGDKPSAVMFAAVNAALSNLLVTEGDRRRVRIEVEREGKEADVTDIAAYFEKRAAAR